MELLQYIEVILKRWWLILMTTVLAAAVAAVISYTTTPLYRSSVTLLVDIKRDPRESAYSTDRNAETVAGVDALKITSPAVAAQIAAQMQVPITTEEVLDMLSASQVAETGMFEVTAQHTDPVLAYTLADTAARVFVEYITAQEANRYVSSIAELEAQIVVLEAQITEARIAIAGYGASETLAPSARAELARLQTQGSNDQTRLTVLLNSTEQFRRDIARTSENISVFHPAAMPTSPSSPQPLRDIALATVVGGMIGVGIAFLLDYLDDTVHTPAELQHTLGVNVLGAIPTVDDEDTCAWLAAAQPLSPAAEALRDLRTSLQYASLDAPLRTLLATSTAPDEGKSFIAANLATTFALTGKRVLLLEGDLRRPKVHHAWHTDRAPGLTDALKAFSETAGDDGPGSATPLIAYTQPTHIEGLYLLTAGTRISTPAELLTSQTFRRMLDALLTVFDMIILDTPPILTVTDAAVLAGYVDGVLVVTASGQTRLPMTVRTIERVEAVGGTLLGLVVNRLSAHSGGYYYRHYQYGYGYDADGEASDLQVLSPSGDEVGRFPALSPAADEAGRFPALSPSGGDRRGVELLPRTHTVTLGTLKHKITLPGELTAAQKLTLAFPTGGRLKAVHVVPGQKVAAGTLLAELDAPAEMQALLREETALAIAQLELAKAEAQAPTADAAATPADFDLAIARERLQLAEALRVYAEERYAQTRLQAPFAGTVLSLICAPGDVVAAHAPVGMLADVSRPRVSARVHALIAPGLDATVRVDGDHDRTLAGTVSADPEVAGLRVADSEVGSPGTGDAQAGDNGSGSGIPAATVNITLLADQELPAVAHAAAEITVHGETRESVPWIPAAALITAGRAESADGTGEDDPAAHYVDVLTDEEIVRAARGAGAGRRRPRRDPLRR